MNTTLEEQIDALEKLPGTQDQTMRTGVIKILYGSEKIDGVTPTSRSLEDQITRLKSRQARRPTPLPSHRRAWSTSGHR